MTMQQEKEVEEELPILEPYELEQSNDDAKSMRCYKFNVSLSKS